MGRRGLRILKKKGEEGVGGSSVGGLLDTTRHSRSLSRILLKLLQQLLVLAVVVVSASMLWSRDDGDDWMTVNLFLHSSNKMVVEAFVPSFTTRSSITAISSSSSRKYTTASRLYYTPSTPRPSSSSSSSSSSQKHQQLHNNKKKQGKLLPPLSHSVLSDSDALPYFPTAHGLLSPETVLRMEQRIVQQQQQQLKQQQQQLAGKGGRGKNNVASPPLTTMTTTSCQKLEMFLKQYRRDGPMACLSFLSDEDVLPRLTEVMRDVL